MEHIRTLQHLESQSWRSAALRDVYSTPDVPGFPWFTVEVTEDGEHRTISHSPRSHPADAGLHITRDTRSLSSAHTDSLARRHVIPYDFTFKVFAKGRWVGQRLIDVYAAEFAHHSRDYYEACARAGRLRCVKKRVVVGVRGNQRRRELKRGVEDCEQPADAYMTPAETELPSLDEPLAQGDVVLHTVHRHEIPVAVGLTGIDPARLVSVRIRRYGLLCVEKPAGVPTHSSGRYQLNSLLTMVEYVLTPKRLARWLWGDDALLQGLVDTSCLTDEEKSELFAYYRPSDCPLHGSREQASRIWRREQALLSSGANSGEVTAPVRCVGASCERVSLDKAPRPCYRLDKVTSGVLLLGVHQDATRRVSQALMEKSLAMETAVAAACVATPVAAAAEQNKRTAEESIRVMLTRPIELRKHYLARVHGAIRTLSSLQHDAWPIDADTARAWFPSQPFPVHACVEDSAAGAYPAACLVTAPVPVQGINALQSAHAPKNHQGVSASAAPAVVAAAEGGVSAQAPQDDLPCDEVIRQSAVTLCQRIALYSPDTAHAESPRPISIESLVHCVPLTGRLHQIRLHLTGLGTPIIGDAPAVRQLVSSHDCSNAAMTPTTHVEDKGPAVGRTWSSLSSSVRTVIWYSPDTLPAGYRAYLAAVTKPVKAEEDTSGYATAKAEETPIVGINPLCSECAHTLPLATIHEDTADSAICLHAWEYEINASVLVGSAKMQSGEEEDEEEWEEAKAGDSAEDVACRDRFCFQRGHMIVFKVPSPQWAHEPL